MIRPIIATALFLTTSAAAEKWIRVTSPNFELYTSQSEKKGRETVLHFEQIREFFEKTTGAKQDSRVPVRIVLFGSEKQYQPYRPNEVAAAYYQPGPDRDYVVIGGYSLDSERIAIHEYVHLMVRHAGLDLPLWLNEGSADLFSTMRPMGSKVFVGDLITEHLYALQEKAIPLTRLFEVNHGAAEYNRKAHAGVFYAESWALTHMLQLTAEYRPKFSQFYQAVVKSEGTAAALEKTYGRSVTEIEKDLKAYVRNNSRFMRIGFPVKFEKSNITPVVSPVDTAGAKAVCAGILIATNRLKDAQTGLSELEAFRDRPDVAEVFAYASWRSGDLSKARAMFETALSVSRPTPKLLMDAARVQPLGKQETKSFELLAKVLAADPEWAEARLQLAEQLLMAGRASESIIELRKIKKVDPSLAARVFRVAGYVEAANGLMAQASQSADASAKYATHMWDKEAASGLREYLTCLEEARSRPSAASTNPVTIKELMAVESFDREDIEIARPRLVRHSATGDERTIEVSEGERVKLIEGNLVQVDCLDTKARLHIESEKGKLALAVHDPANIVVRSSGNNDDKGFELQCGPQKKKIRADYVVAEDAKFGTQGVLKIVELVP